MPARNPCACFGPGVLCQICFTLNRAGTLKSSLTHTSLTILLGTLSSLLKLTLAVRG
jgi:hypothetical protein